MIDPDPTAFPTNIVFALVPYMQAIHADTKLYRRPLRSTDDHQSIGVFPMFWDPDQDSYEMRGNPTNIPGPRFPTLTQYQIGLQSLIRDGDEERGIARNSAFTAHIRATVARDAGLRLTLGQLNSTILGHTENVIKWEIGRQRFITGEVQGTWMYISSLSIVVHTQAS